MLYFYIIFILISEKIAQELFLIDDMLKVSVIFTFVKKILLKMRSLDVVHSFFTGCSQSKSPEKLHCPGIKLEIEPVMMVLSSWRYLRVLIERGFGPDICG